MIGHLLVSLGLLGLTYLTGMWVMQMMTVRHQVIVIQLPPGVNQLPPNTTINVAIAPPPAP